ncbi:hypothetical protein BH10PSE1_BH10PSE1_12320 [soil metagenome]
MATHMRLEQLVYVSTATEPVRSVMDVSDILEQSVRNNPANNVTGALAFTETRFVQLLEGSVSSLDVLLLKLMLDPRHRALTIIDRVPIKARSFDRWSMLSPVFTSAGRDRLESLVAQAMLPVDHFRLLLLDMIAEQSAAIAARLPDAGEA